MSRLRVRHAYTYQSDEVAAVADLRSQLDADGASGVLFFCSTSYDLARLGAEIRGAFSVPVAGCTSSGQLGPMGFQKGGITAVSLTSSELHVVGFSTYGEQYNAVHVNQTFTGVALSGGPG